MNDGSSRLKDSASNSEKLNLKTKSLQDEWSILIQGFVEDEIDSSFDPKIIKTVVELRKSGLGEKDFHKYSKDLSEQRKKINNQIENIKRSIDSLYTKIDTLELVEAETSEIQRQIEKLNQEGEELSKALLAIDKKSKLLRDSELPT